MSAHMSFPVADFPAARRLRLLASAPRRRDLVRLNSTLQERLAQAAERIAALEKTLSQATRDALTDGLTGLANRRAFDVGLRDAASQSGHDASLLLLDIDHFKVINDTYGHQAGDEALRRIGQTIAAMVRHTDLAARYGGEEFAVLLPSTGRAGALALAEALRAGIAARRLALGDGAPVSVTVSVGVASFEFGETPAAWVARADVALYLAKQAGRDRAIFCDVPVREGAVV
jgi:diguanylate cyclase